ncbi:hypothetical protein VTN02DRAFT_2342 [Thermoascus thermophilus]
MRLVSLVAKVSQVTVSHTHRPRQPGSNAWQGDWFCYQCSQDLVGKLYQWSNKEDVSWMYEGKKHRDVVQARSSGVCSGAGGKAQTGDEWRSPRKVPVNLLGPPDLLQVPKWYLAINSEAWSGLPTGEFGLMYGAPVWSHIKDQPSAARRSAGVYSSEPEPYLKVTVLARSLRHLVDERIVRTAREETPRFPCQLQDPPATGLSQGFCKRSPIPLDLFFFNRRRTRFCLDRKWMVAREPGTVGQSSVKNTLHRPSQGP